VVGRLSRCPRRAGCRRRKTGGSTKPLRFFYTFATNGKIDVPTVFYEDQRQQLRFLNKT
jgi:hypothetical protein